MSLFVVNIMKIFSKYAGEWILPNECIPVYAVWDPAETVELLKLKRPSALKIENVYNSVLLSDENGIAEISSIDTPGYVLIELSSSDTKKLQQKHSIFLEFWENGFLKEKLSLKVKVLRPKLVIQRVPSSIKVVRGKARQKITIQYCGFGHIFVLLGSTKDSEIEVKVPPSLKEMLEDLLEDFNLAIEDVLKRFPELKEFFEPFSEEELRSTTQFNQKFDELIHFLKKHKEPYLEFSKSLSLAISRSIRFEELLLRPLIEFFRSLPTENIVLMNPLDELLVETEKKALKLRLRYFDMAQNNYSELELETEIVGDVPTSLRIHELLDWSLGELYGSE